MLKKYMTLLLVITALVLAACSGSPNISTTAAADATAAQTEQTTRATEETEVAPSMGVGERGDYGDETVPETEPGVTEATEPGTTEPAPTEPADPTPDTTEPAETAPEEQLTVTYSQYLAMTEDEQEAFINSFPTLQAFVDWWNAAKAAEGSGGDIITGDPSIDLGDMIP